MSDMETTPVERPLTDEPAGIVPLAAGWASAVGARVKLMAELALAEARLAAISVALMAFLAVLAAAFVFAAWGLLMASVVLGLLQLQVPLWPALLALGGLHILLGVIAWRAALRLGDNLEFRASREQFKLQEEKADDMVSSAAASSAAKS